MVISCEEVSQHRSDQVRLISRNDCCPINDPICCSILDIKEIHAGLTPQASSLFPGISQSARAANNIVTVLYHPNLVVAFEMKSIDDRNFLVNGLRALVSEIQLDTTVAIGGPTPGPVRDADGSFDYKAKYESMLSQV